MVKILVEFAHTLITKARVPVAELTGVALVTYAAAGIYRPAGFVVAGLAVLAKSVEWDLKDEK